MRQATAKTLLEPMPETNPAGRERRAERRYPLDQDLVCRRHDRPREAAAVRGRTINMSSHGLLFEADLHWADGEELEMAIDWPAKLDNHCSLKLVVSGRVTRSANGRTALKIMQYEFKTAGERGPRL